MTLLASTRNAEAQVLGFAQCVQLLQRTLLGTPAGWGLVAWLTYGKAPTSHLLAWVGGFGVIWLANLLILRGVSRQGSVLERHRWRLWCVAALDGCGWGLMMLLLMAHDRLASAWLVVVLCGAVSVNVPTYITFPSAFRVLLLSTWGFTAVSGVFLAQSMSSVPQLLLGLAVYFVMLAYTFRPVSARVIRGIQLQLDNVAMAGQLREALTQMEYQATTDVLTGQMNRRALDAMLHNYTSAALGRQFRFSALMLDIDHFKLVNDTHGHPVGDQALAAVAERIVAQLRGGDSCARYGGEEFVVMLPDASQAQALEVAQRIRHAVAASPLPTEPALRLSVSIGVAQHRPGMSAQALLAAADAAVYLAKREGRNQVRAAPDPPDLSLPADTVSPDHAAADRRQR